MPKLTIDGNEVDVEAGVNLIEAGRRVGVEIPHYCYHPGLPVAGSCRMCFVEIEGTPKLSIACFTEAKDGMVVRTETPKVKRTRQAILEFLLINHPLDCPVCDQAGECFLQIYYMEHGLYDSRLRENKTKKTKAKVIGPHVILDQERCILCSRCLRFCDEVSGSSELGIFSRGDRSVVDIFEGRPLDNPYSGNVVDLCPVGALTDRNFRFRCRVWYLDQQKSICPGCARGCNIDLHVNLRRPHESEGQRVLRLKPRCNPEVNRWWLCDEGRYGFDFIDADDRIVTPTAKIGEDTVAGWDKALGQLAEKLKATPTEQIGILASPQLTNEELFLVQRVFVKSLGVHAIDYRVPPAQPGSEDDFLRKADKNPNTRGAEAIGLSPSEGQRDASAILEAVRSGDLRVLLVFGHDLYASIWPEDDVAAALTALDTLVFIGSNANRTSQRADLVLPTATYAENEGTFTNFEGRVQRIRQAIPPSGEALQTWQFLLRLATELGIPLPFHRSREIFAEMAQSVRPFSGLSYESIGDRGGVLHGGEEQHHVG